MTFIVSGTSGLTFPDTTAQTTAATASVPSGSVMLFLQTSAPSGWTKLTTSNDVALRLVSGAASSGGSVAFSTAFASQNVGSTTLSTAQIPAHTHAVYLGVCNGSGASIPQTPNSGSYNSGSAGGGGSHTHTLNIAVSYVDVIQASKN
jgi:hypothetical protein